MSERAPEVLRSGFCAEGVRGGTRLLLTHEDGWFDVATRWETIGRCRDLNEAVRLFEAALLGLDKATLPATTCIEHAYGTTTRLTFQIKVF